MDRCPKSVTWQLLSIIVGFSEKLNGLVGWYGISSALQLCVRKNISVCIWTIPLHKYACTITVQKNVRFFFLSLRTALSLYVLRRVRCARETLGNISAVFPNFSTLF